METTRTEQAAHTPVVSLTANAARKVAQMMARENRTSGVLRVAVMGGGCSGLQYRMDLEDAPSPQDSVTEFHGIRVAVDPKSARLLAGTEIDFVFALQNGGFKIRNPNATQSCSCGESFCP